MMDTGKIFIGGGISKMQREYNQQVMPSQSDSVENLLTQVLQQALDNRDALGNMRHALLGPFPEPAPTMDITDKPVANGGLVGGLKDILYKILEIQATQREHISFISQGVH